METTTSGKEISITTAFRLPASSYQAAQEIAQKRGERLSATMRRLVAAGLAAQQRQGQEAPQEVHE